MNREAKLIQKCEVMAALIIATRQVYASANEQQRAFLETVIGAGIWYIPKPVHAWTGKISKGALAAFHPDSGVAKPKLSEEHVYPRKVAARLLLQDKSLTSESLIKQFSQKFGRVHLITSEENKAVQPFQRVGVFTIPEAAYEAAGIALIEISDDELRKVKKRDKDVIEMCLAKAK